jgi:hypothetical protein
MTNTALLSYARDAEVLAARAAEVGAKAGSPAEAAAFGGVVSRTAAEAVM